MGSDYEGGIPRPSLQMKWNEYFNFTLSLNLCQQAHSKTCKIYANIIAVARHCSS